MTKLAATISKLLAPLFWAVVLVSLGVAASIAAQTRDQARAEFHETYDLSPDGIVSLSNVSGYIRVSSWGENRVKVDAVKRSHRSGEDLSLVEIQVYTRPERVEIRTIYPRSRSTGISVDYDVKVPRSAVLNTINSTSGDIRVTGPVARVVAHSVSGNVTTQDTRGDANLTTTSGQIIADRIGGALTIVTTSGDLQISDVGTQLTARSTSGQIQAVKIKDDAELHSTSGNIKLERAGGRVASQTISGWVSVNDAAGDVKAGSVSNSVTIENVRGRVVANSTSSRVIVRNAQEGVRANTVSGSIEITNTKGRIEANSTSGMVSLRDVDSRDVHATSFSGGVRFQGKLHDDGRYEFQSFSGEIVLTLPAESNFNLTAKTSTGVIDTDFPIRLIGSFGGPGSQRRLEGTHGNGGAQISATGFSGSIRLKKQ